MKNFIQPGKTVTLPAPYALASGEGFLIGKIFAVANGSAAAGVDVEGVTEGVFALPKVVTTPEAWVIGDAIYWDAVQKACTIVSTGHVHIGVAVRPAEAADTS